MTSLKVRCPTCQKIVPFTAAYPFRPFCNERCKLIDLGGWANEDYKIPLSSTDNQEQDTSDDEKK